MKGHGGLLIWSCFFRAWIEWVQTLYTKHFCRFAVSQFCIGGFSSQLRFRKCVSRIFHKAIWKETCWNQPATTAVSMNQRRLDYLSQSWQNDNNKLDFTWFPLASRRLERPLKPPRELTTESILEPIKGAMIKPQGKRWGRDWWWGKQGLATPKLKHHKESWNTLEKKHGNGQSRFSIISNPEIHLPKVQSSLPHHFTKWCLFQFD